MTSSIFCFILSNKNAEIQTITQRMHPNTQPLSVAFITTDIDDNDEFIKDIGPTLDDRLKEKLLKP